MLQSAIPDSEKLYFRDISGSESTLDRDMQGVDKQKPQHTILYCNTVYEESFLWTVVAEHAPCCILFLKA